MQTVSAEQPLRLDRDAAWERLRDLSRANQYVPGLTRVEFAGEQREGPGTERRVHFGECFAMEETVTEWRPGEAITLRLRRPGKGPMPPFREQFFDYRIEERDGQVWLVNRMRYQVGLGPLGALLDRLVLRRVITRQLRDITLAQKIHYETGDQVTPARLQSARAEQQSA